jgi:hypothetical protein
MLVVDRGPTFFHHQPTARKCGCGVQARFCLSHTWLFGSIKLLNLFAAMCGRQCEQLRCRDTLADETFGGPDAVRGLFLLPRQTSVLSTSARRRFHGSAPGCINGVDLLGRVVTSGQARTSRPKSWPTQSRASHVVAITSMRTSTPWGRPRVSRTVGSRSCNGCARPVSALNGIVGLRER